MIFVDTNVLLDVVTDDPKWKSWSLPALNAATARDALGITDVVYAELSVRYSRLEDLDDVVVDFGLAVVSAPRPALFLAGKAFQRYRAAGGARTGVLPDFFIGAHAAIFPASLVTRDPRRYRTYFPNLRLIAPENP